jgi:hypothetical protein
VKKKGSMLRNSWNIRCLLHHNLFCICHVIMFIFIKEPSKFCILFTDAVFFFFFFFFFFGEYQNKRGGKVRLQSMLMPWSEFDHSEKGDALYGKF